MGRDNPKVRMLYEDLYRQFGIEAAWMRPRKRVFEDPTMPHRPSRLRKEVGLSEAAKAKLARVTAAVPEVMVKVSGRTRDSGHLKAHMEYITRNGKVEADTDYGRIKGKEVVNDLHADWSDDEVIYKGQHNVRRAPLSVNLVLSMPPGVDREAFRNAVRDFVDAEIRPRVDVIVAFHDDTMHPHAHVTVRGRQHNGRTFNPGKPVLEHYRERFAAALRARGIEAEATPRFARGRTMKSDRQQIRYLRARGLVPRNDQRAISEVYGELQRRRHGPGKGQRGQRLTADRPWETAARTRHESVRAIYSAAAKDLAQSGNTADRQLARQVQQFVRSMPKPLFRRDLYLQALEKQLAKGERGRGHEKKREGPER